jgi:hypothetical protein
MAKILPIGEVDRLGETEGAAARRFHLLQQSPAGSI